MPSPSLPPKLAMGRMPVLSVKAKHLFALPRRKDGCRAYPCPYIAVDRILTEKSCEDSVCMSFPAALRYRLPEFCIIRITSEFQIMNGRRVITEGAIVRLLNRLEDPLHAVLQQTIPATSCFASTRRSPNHSGGLTWQCRERDSLTVAVSQRLIRRYAIPHELLQLLRLRKPPLLVTREDQLSIHPHFKYSS